MPTDQDGGKGQLARKSGSKPALYSPALTDRRCAAGARKPARCPSEIAEKPRTNALITHRPDD